MSILLATERGFRMGGRARLVGTADHMQAWAEKHVRKDADIKYMLGNYVEANKANLNGHSFPLEDLAPAVGTIEDKALNMLHRERHVVGTFVGAQLLTAEGAEITAADFEDGNDVEGSNPYVEALSVIWHRRFPDEYFEIKKADAEGTLFYSMESIPGQISAPGSDERYDWEGFGSDTYPPELRADGAPMVCHDPTFVGGAIVIPPAKPGWERADLKTLAAWMSDDALHDLYQQVSDEAPELSPKQWEAAMAALVELAKD